MQSITTKFLPATNTKGARIKATATNGKSITIPYGHCQRSEQEHRDAAKALRDKLEWKGVMIGGAIKGGYCFVFASADSDLTIE